jgi:hypothetical protein
MKYTGKDEHYEDIPCISWPDETKPLASKEEDVLKVEFCSFLPRKIVLKKDIRKCSICEKEIRYFDKEVYYDVDYGCDDESEYELLIFCKECYEEHHSGIFSEIGEEDPIFW